MKLLAATGVALSFALGANAFVTPAGSKLALARGAATMKMNAPVEGRGAFLSKVLGAAGGLVFAQGASAASYFGGKDEYPEVVKPQDAIKDEEVFSSASTKEAVQRLRKYKEVASALQDKLAGNPGVDLRAEIRKDFDISPLRESLNKAGIAFDEDSQRGLDRIIRLIIQDTLELDEAAKLKPGVERTPRRLSTMKAKLTKLDAAFDEILKFFGN